ncbi:hypothetical protein CHUAL_007488 [Chamberlinius hualienensis]
MEFMKLSEVELRYFNELFNHCDVENNGKVSGVKAGEVLRASHLPPESLQLITDICGAKRLGHFGRSQFYIAMKLIAAAQMGLPIKLETISSGIELPLPKFTRLGEDKLPQKQYSQSLSVDIESVPSDGQLLQTVKNQTKTNVTILKPLSISVENEKITSPSGDSSQTTPFGNESFGEVSSPRNPNTVEKEWSVYLNNKQSYVSDYDQWQQFEDERQLLTTEDDNSERHSSDDEYDVWSISNEQREYYVNQFRLLQPDLGGLLTGAVAKEFFEKSKLPVLELSKIWQLSDVNKDGALCLEEFFTAMHLVVLRRNNVELPDSLPPVLIPHINSVKPAKENSNKSLGSPDSSPPHANFSVSKEDPKILHPVAVRLSPDGQIIGDNEIDTGEINHSGKEMSDLHKGIAKRLSAGTSGVPVHDEISESVGGPPSQVVIQRPIARKASNLGAGAIPPPPTGFATNAISPEETHDGVSLPLTSSFSGSSSASMPLAYPSLGINASSGPKKDPPPPPPPRPKRNHARSSSLDLNRLGKVGFAAPPAVPPRVSPSMRLVSQKSESDACGGSVMSENLNFAAAGSHVVGTNETEDDYSQVKVVELCLSKSCNFYTFNYLCK